MNHTLVNLLEPLESRYYLSAVPSAVTKHTKPASPPPAAQSAAPAFTIPPPAANSLGADVLAALSSPDPLDSLFSGSGVGITGDASPMEISSTPIALSLFVPLSLFATPGSAIGANPFASG